MAKVHVPFSEDVVMVVKVTIHQNEPPEFDFDIKRDDFRWSQIDGVSRAMRKELKIRLAKVRRGEEKRNE